MRVKRRFLCLILALLSLVSLVPEPAVAAGTIYFTAVNDALLDLNDETMPFWSGGVLYVPHTVVDRDQHELGIYYNRGADGSFILLYKMRSNLYCDLTNGTISDHNTKQVFSGTLIVRGDVVFLPLDVLCRFFDLEYTYTRISYGYLIRIKSNTVVLSDSTFIDAASSPMANRYMRYERAHAPAPVEPEPQSVSNDPDPNSGAAGSSPAAPGNAGGENPAGSRPETPEAEPEPEEARSVYLVVESTDVSRSELVLSHLSSEHAAFLFAPEALTGSDDFLRRLTADGSSVALRVDAAEGPEEALRQIEDSNRALWRAANAKTRLVYLSGASEDTVRAVSEAGYCPLHFALDYTGEAPTRASARILSAADANGGSCCVFLGTDEGVSGTLRALLANLRDGNCTTMRLNESAA